MRFTSTFVLAAAGLAAAQSSSSSAAPAESSASTAPSGCGSATDAIIAACLQSTSIQLNACKANAWGCMCTAQKNIVTCYNNCPADPAAAPAQQQETSWCNAAKAFPATSSTPKSNGQTTVATVGTATTATTTSGRGVQTGFASQSGSAAAQSSTGAASGFTPAGGLIAAIFGLALL
ncbi:hypothetical protein LTR09_003895 [Extremus antarcticus]|uniref:GPI anchored serine-threonine rich protein n=1 Tax=Extremus antarcticus TaxID=702011 RepID=A0AAJ0DJL4_9PEZI|nr:hypothetical protein LTR09_003895 [Extremus antarcticus]